MKTASLLHRSRAACAALAILFLAAAHAENAPRIDVLHVAKIATDYLATHGREAAHVTSIVLENEALMGGKTSWIVRFSRPIVADGNREVGMRVKLDGSVSFLIEDQSGPKKRAVPVKS